MLLFVYDLNLTPLYCANAERPSHNWLPAADRHARRLRTDGPVVFAEIHRSRRRHRGGTGAGSNQIGTTGRHVDSTGCGKPHSTRDQRTAAAEIAQVMARDAGVSGAPFHYRNGVLHVENLKLSDLAEQFGSPLFAYSERAIEHAYADFAQALAATAHLICFAVKANSALAILQILARLGAGFDIVSLGELERVLRAGGDPQRVVFSGVGKSTAEIRRALEVGIRCFNIESAAELERVNAVAIEMQKQAPVALRINPEIHTNTHPYISTGHAAAKFGIDMPTAEPLAKRALGLPGIRLIGLACHIGSQLTEVAPYAEAARSIVGLADRLADALLRGGGFADDPVLLERMTRVPLPPAGARHCGHCGLVFGTEHTA